LLNKLPLQKRFEQPKLLRLRKLLKCNVKMI
jgi:hypothetical protein